MTQVVPAEPTARCPYCRSLVVLYLDSWDCAQESGRRCRHYVEPQRIDGKLYVVFQRKGAAK